MITRPIILASSSPRRQYLMKEAGFIFSVAKPDVEEDFPEVMPVPEVPRYLALKKSEYFRPRIHEEIIVAADTVVVLHDRIMNKPENASDAFRMLSELSGNKHLVITGVSIVSKDKKLTFDDITEVTFKSLSKDEITYYVDNYKPFDKAGAYGAQDWIGMVAIEKIVGSYFNVMGLPIHKVYQSLVTW